MSGMIELETRHLRLRPFTPDDLDPLVALFSDHEVMRFVGTETGQTASHDQTAISLSKYIQYWQQHGIGRMALIHKSDDKLIGFCGLRWFEPTGEPEIVYLLAKEYWGRGLATEAATACLKYDFEQKGFDRIIGVTLKANAASWRVMEKLGMRYEGEAQYYGTNCVRYVAAREEFQVVRNQT